MEGAPEQPEGAKKGPFDGLDRDELILKLKGLLSVYKNAKQAKDEIASENAQLKDTLASLQLQKSADKEYLKGLQSSIQKLNETVAILEEQKTLDKNYMKGMHEMVDEVTNEKNTLTNRVTRLSQENEQLLGDCRKTDAILMQLNDSLAQHQQQVQQLQKMCEQQKAVNTDLRKNHAAETARNDHLEEQLGNLRTKCESHESKLKLYRTKLVDFSGQLKELRLCKEVLLTTVREYSQAVNKWQGEILTVSNDFFEKNRNLKEENRVLEERVSSLSATDGECDRCAESLKKYEELVEQFEKIVRDNMELGALVKNIESQRQVASEDKDVLDSKHLEVPTKDELREQELENYRILLLQLDESLKSVHQEALHYKDVQSNERQMLEDRCVALTTEVIELKAQLETVQTFNAGEHDKTIEMFRQEAEQIREELASNTCLLQDRDTAISQYTSQIVELESQLELLKATLETVRSDGVMQKNTFDELVQAKSEEVNALNNALDDLRVESTETITKLQDSLQSLTVELTASKLCVEDLRGNLQQSVVDSTVSQEIEEKSQELARITETLRAEIKQAQEELVTEKSVHASLVQERDATIAENALSINELRSMCSSLTAELEEQKLNLSTQKTSFETLLDEQTRLVQTKITEINELNATLESLRNNSTDAIAKMQESQKAIALELSASKMCVDDLRGKLQKTAAIKDMSGELATLQSKSEELSNVIEALRKERQHVNEELAAEKTAHAAVLAERDNMLEKSARASELDSMVKSMTIELEAVNSNLSSEKESIRKVQANLEQSTAELDAAKALIDELQGKLQQSIAATESSVELSAMLSQTQNSIEALTLENQRVKEQLSADQASFASLLLERDSTLANSQMDATDKALSIQSLTNELQSLRQDFSVKIQELTQQLADSKQLLLGAQSELKEAEHKAVAQLSDIQRALDEKENIIKSKQLEMEDLLSEMRELNEALRNRGDIISKQEQKINGLNVEVAEKTMNVECLRTEHEQLIERLREAENMPKTHDISCDQLSTSTVSRIEEITRMRDVEDSFEEKYNKLRSIAVRLKKKISEQTKRIEELEASATPDIQTQSKPSSANQPSDVQLRNLQQLQKQNDQLQDDLESGRAAEKRNAETIDQLSKKLTEVTAELAAMKMINDEIKNTATASSNQKSSLDQAIKEYLKQITALKDELVLEKKQNQSMTDEMVLLKENIQRKENEISKIAADLKKAKSSVKKSNVLNLEMEAQEKSLIDISQKLETKNLQVDELNLTIKQQEESVASLKHQIVILEQTVSSEKEHALDVKQQLDLNQARLKEIEYEKSELKIRLDEMQHEKSTACAELVESRLSSEQSATENEKCLALLRTENARHLQRIAVLDESVSDLTAKLRNTDQELMDLKTEFVAYKVRAQSMLRQNQQKESSREIELEDELSTVQGTNQSLTAKLKAAVDQNKGLEGTVADLRQECDRLQTHSKHLMQLVDESRLNAESLQEEVRRQNVDHQEALKSQRLQIDTLNSCYKKEIAELNEKHARDMQSQLQQVRVQDENRNPRLMPSEAAPKGAQQRTPPTTDEQRIDWLLMERQDAEGSESNQSQTQSNNSQRKLSSTRGRRDLIPLDELLNSSFETATFTDGSSSPTFDLQATKDRLHIQESRVKHLTTLLAEAEQDTARLTQLNDALKEEVRRQERSAEREKHLHNLEYLKNVMFKFLTIHNGDEKVHLVPVLNTMLKLSPDETLKLQNVAKGTDSSQRAGWRGYLPV